MTTVRFPKKRHRGFWPAAAAMLSCLTLGLVCGLGCKTAPQLHRWSHTDDRETYPVNPSLYPSAPQESSATKVASATAPIERNPDGSQPYTVGPEHPLAQQAAAIRAAGGRR